MGKFTIQLSNITIQAIILPLHKFLLNQPINVPLDTSDIQRTPILRDLDSLGNKLTVGNPLPCFEDSHNSSLGFVVAIGGDTLMSLLVFGSGFFELHRVDLDAVLGVGEGGVDGEGVGGINFATFGVLG